jgi:hypothetical protein
MVLNVTVSPEFTVKTGGMVASKNPVWAVWGEPFKVCIFPVWAMVAHPPKRNREIKTMIPTVLMILPPLGDF